MQQTVNDIVQPLIKKYHIPGMAVALTVDGKNYFYNYGVISEKNPQPVTAYTLFELGSITKTFTATLASYAQQTKALSLTDNTSQYLPVFRGTVFDHVSLLNLGTHTSGLPLFVPKNIQTLPQLITYLQQWKPPYPIGSHRIYSNIGIGLLGLSTAESLHVSYSRALKRFILQPLKLNHTFLFVPPDQEKNYAQGYTAQNIPIRLHPGVLWQEAYGLKSCSTDMIRYVEANMQEIPISFILSQALLDTHTTYFQAPYFMQDLVWEQYPYPARLQTIITGNNQIFFHSPVQQFIPPLAPQTKMLFNKTGSTNGFCAYMAFIPQQKLGVVLLANKIYPLEQEITAGYHLLSQF